jgi:apolipoprotein N-acyltransferase
MFSTIALVFALVLFIIAGALNPPADAWRTRLVCFGLACWVAAEMLRGIGSPIH